MTRSTACAPCNTCGEMMRPSGSRMADYPGTVSRNNKVTCVNCHRRGMGTKIHGQKTTEPKPPQRSTRRPTKEAVAVLCRYFGNRSLTMTGEVVGVTPDLYTLRIDGEEIDFDRDHWQEVVP
jgi:hypothetical protein